jgi:hypothetical protein
MYKTICGGTFHQRSKSTTITEKLRAIDALIKEERGVVEQFQGRRASNQFDVAN